MTESLGKCSICGKEAGVLYPLLQGEPAFCSTHHNPRDAGPFGCDFIGPDDFDIPFDDEDIPFHTPKPQKLNRDTFIWTDKEGNRNPLADIGDQYLQNIINYLERGQGYIFGESKDRRKKVINFLKKEQEIRSKKYE